MQSERKIVGYRFLSVLLILTLVITLVSPAKTVKAAAAPMFGKTSQSILVGDTHTINLKNKIAGAHYAWSSTDKSVAKVSQKGVVTGLSKGSTTIRCKIDTKSRSYRLECSIAVRQPADEVSISNKIDYLKIGDKYDLNQKLKPTKANEVTIWSTSDPSILSVDKKGVITAKSLGLATITATTSKDSDSIVVYVVGQEKGEITKKDVVNGTITLSDKSYGDLSISSNVGDVKIVLDNVTVGGTLQMESGAAYTVMTNQCTINKVEAVNTLVKSLALGDEEETATPSLVAGYGSIIVTIDSECNISVKQSNGAVIQSFSVTTSADGSIQISLEGFKGDLVIDSTSTAAINIATTACEMNSATVKNATEGQPISLTDTNAGTDQASTIKAVNMAANAALKVDVKAEEVMIAKEVSQADITISQPVTKLTNEGSQTSMTINSEVKNITSTGNASAVSLGDTAKVTNLRVEGAQTNVDLKSGAQVTNVTTLADNTKVNLSEGATIQKVNAFGNSTAIEGTGKVEEAVVTGNDAKINTEGTNVQVALGTTNVTVKGVEVKEEDKIAIATPTPTPAPTATPTPKPTATPIPKVSATPKPSTTPKPSATPSPKPTAIPTPTSVPVVNPPFIPSGPGTSPTSTPSPSPSPSPSPTPVPTSQEKLAVYMVRLADLHTTTTQLIATKNTANYSAVKNSFANLKNTLTTYEELDKSFPQISISDNISLIYDYADYAELLIASGKDYGLPIRQYYESAKSDTQTYEQALAAANRLIHMVYRINTEGPMFKGDVAGVFTSLGGSAAAFRTAMNKLLTDNEEFTPFAENEAAYYQKGMLDFVNNDTTVNAYYKADSLTFFQAMNCFIILNDYYGVLKDSHAKTTQYQTLLNNFIDSLPAVNPIYDDQGHYNGAVYDLTGKKEAVLNNIEAIMNSIDPDTIWEDTEITLTLRGKYEELIIEDIIRKLYTTETYVNNEYEMLNYYRLNRAAQAANPDDHVIREAVVAVVCCIKDVTDYNNGYLLRYQALTNNIIDAAQSDSAGAADQVYNALLALYDAKLADPEFSDRWKEYPYPEQEDKTPFVDKAYYLSFIQSKLEPLADTDDKGQMIDSKLYLYNQIRTTATAQDLGQAIYVIKSAVEECNGWLKKNYDSTKAWVFALMEAVEVKDSETVYASLSNICDYMQDTYSVTEGKNFAILEPIYAPGYMIALRDNMLGADSDTDFKRFYEMEVGPDDYSRHLGEIENGALWSIAWWMSEEADVDYIKQEAQDYSTWMPIREDIQTAIYDSTASVVDKNNALKDIINKLGTNDQFLQNHMQDLPGISKINYDAADLELYLDAIECRMADNTTEVYPLYEYDQLIKSGQIPDNSLLSATAEDLLRVIMVVEERKLLNNLCTAIQAEDAANTYTALTAIYNHVADVVEDQNNKLLPDTYARAYLWEFYYWIKEENSENDFSTYYNKLIHNEIPDYSNKLDDEIIRAFWTAHAQLTNETGERLETRFADASGCEDELNALLVATAGTDIETFATAIDVYYKAVDKSIYEVPVDAVILSKYIYMLKTNLINELNFDGSYENGEISYLHYYNTNKNSLNEGDKLLAMYHCNNWLVNSIYHNQNNSNNYLDLYKPLVDNAISSAIAINEEGLYNAIVALYQAKLDENSGSSEEWSQYTKPFHEDGTPNIDKHYFLQYIQSKLQAGTEQDEEGNVCDSALYTYNHLGTEAIADDLNAVIYQLKDAVYESELWLKVNYDTTFDMIQAIMQSVEENNAAAVYAALNDIYDFMGTTYQEDHTFIIWPEKYAPMYGKLLRNMMNDGETRLAQYNNSNPAKDVYSRYFGELCMDALWDVSWWLSDDAGLQQQLTEEFGEFDRWSQVMDNIATFRYQDAATPEEKLAALKNIFTIVGNDEAMMSERLDNLPGIKNFEPILEHIGDYWGALSLRIEDETEEVDENSGEPYYRYALHSYDLAITSNNIPDFWIVYGACAELVESVLCMENIFTLNDLINATKANDTEQAYAALGKLNQYFTNIKNREDSKLLDAANAGLYMVDLNNMLKDTEDPNNWFNKYSEWNTEGLPEQLSFDIEEVIDGAIHYVQGNVLTTDYYDMNNTRALEVINGRDNVDAVIAAANGSVEDFSAALNQLIADAKLSVYFGDQEMADFTLIGKYAVEIQQSMQYSLEHERYEDDQICWPNYYNNNKASLGNDTVSVVYEVLSNIIGTTNGIIRNNEIGLQTYIPIVDAVIAGALADDEVAVLLNLRLMYQAKMNENPEDWSKYGKPEDSQGNNLINISYCMDLIKASLKDEANYLHMYQNNANPVFQDVQYVIYNLKDIVETSQLNGPAGWMSLMDTMINTEDVQEWQIAAHDLHNKIISSLEIDNWIVPNDQVDLFIDESMISAYMANIAKHKSDSIIYGEEPSQWFDSIYEYELRKDEDLLPYDGLLQRVGIDLMYSLIEVNRNLDMFEHVNNLYSKVLEGKVSETYSAIAAINSYVNEVYPEAQGTLRGSEYSVAYYNVLMNRINHSTIENDTYPVYLLLYNANAEKTYSFSNYDIVMNIMFCTQWYTRGEGDPIITEEYSQYTSWSNIKDSIDTILNDFNADAMTLSDRLDTLAGYAKTEAVMTGSFTEDDLAKLNVNEANIEAIRTSMLGLITDDASMTGQYNKFILQNQYPSYELIHGTCLELSRVLINNNNQ